MLQISYSTPEERAAVVLEQTALNHYLLQDHTNFDGSAFLLFEDDVAKTTYAAGLKTDAILQKLAAASFTDIDTWVDNNITTLAAARELLKKMLMVMSYLLNK